jgi:hypothetical protein
MMLEIEDVVHWLRDGDENAAADFLSQCEFSYGYLDTGLPVDGGQEIDIYDLTIACSRRYFQNLSQYKEATTAIKKAISDCAPAANCWIKNIYFGPKLGGSKREFPSDHEVEKILETVDVLTSKKRGKKQFKEGRLTQKVL